MKITSTCGDSPAGHGSPPPPLFQHNRSTNSCPTFLLSFLPGSSSSLDLGLGPAHGEGVCAAVVPLGTSRTVGCRGALPPLRGAGAARLAARLRWKQPCQRGFSASLVLRSFLLYSKHADGLPWRHKIFPLLSFSREPTCPNESAGKRGQERSYWEQSSLAQAALRDSQRSREREQHPRDSVGSYANLIKKLSFDTAVYDVASLDGITVFISSELVLHSVRAR